MQLFKKQVSNRCYTYFRIVGDFDPKEISIRLGLQPFQSWKIGDKRKDGTKYTFSACHFAKCDTYNVATALQMEKTIQQMKAKTTVLNAIREEYDVSFYLEVVPSLYSYNTAPSLSPSMDVIDFCHATRTEIDIDLYISD